MAATLRHITPHIRVVRLFAAGATLVVATALSAQTVGGIDSRDRSTLLPSYPPGSRAHTVPKFDYAEDGRVVMVKRFALFPAADPCQYTRYRFFENQRGVENVSHGIVLRRSCVPVTEQQKTIIREWGEPDYLRGPYKSTRHDTVTEWAFLATNRLFQFVDGQMVYEGPLTDQERTAILHGAPRDVVVNQVDPNVRRETWYYYPVFLTGRERVYSFANGKLVFSQEAP